MNERRESAGEDGVFHAADARVDEGDGSPFGDEVGEPSSARSVQLTARDVPHPIHVRYAWAANPRCNLENELDLPAILFRNGP